MNLNKLIPPAALFAMLALFAPLANAQTMGEYATATAGVATGGGSMGTNFGPASIGANSVRGSSGTWAANGLGASFEERAGAASASSAGGDFESRAGSLTSSSTGEPRWPQSRFSSDNSSFGGG